MLVTWFNLDAVSFVDIPSMFSGSLSAEQINNLLLAYGATLEF